MYRKISVSWVATVAVCVQVSLGAATEISSFQAGDGGWQMGTLAVGNLDSDSQLEIVVPYRNSSGQWFLDAFKPNGTRLPGFPYAGDAEINVSPTLYDLDGDGRDEILFTCGARVVALRGDGAVLWSTPVNRLNYVPDSGYMTVTNGFYWSTNGKWIPHLPTNAVFSSQVSSPIVADIDGNGTREVVTAWKIDPDSTGDAQDFNPFINDIWSGGEWGTVGESWSGGVILFNANTGAKDYVYHIHQLVESGLALGRADENRPLETYVLNDSDSVVCFDKTKPYGVFGSGNLHGQFGKNQRLMSGSYEQGVDIYTADVDGDGRPEVLVPTTQLNPLWQPSETILDDDGAILWRQWKPAVSYPLNQWQNSACMIPVNPDHDNHVDVMSFTQSYEIDYAYWDGVNLVSHTGWQKSFYPYLPTPPVMGDVDGDGQEEIVIGTYNPATNPSAGGLYVFGLDGTLKYSMPVPGGLKHIPMLANVEGKGLDVVYRSLAGRVYIENFGATQSGPVSWSTHRGNAHRDGNFNASLFPAGTPIITGKESGYHRASFSWRTTTNEAVTCWRIYRAKTPVGPFAHVATLTANTSSYTDAGLNSGVQYMYEIGAVFTTNTILSAPFPVLSFLNNNLVANSGFEQNDNSHWDKWFSGEIAMTNMSVTTNTAYEGRQSMEIQLHNQGGGGSISQYNQYGTPDAFLPVTPGKLYSFGGFFKSGGLSQTSEHWLEWSSTKTAEDTNDRPARPYPDYFTPHFVIGTNATDWIYANRTFVMPTGFPNVELAHRYSIAAPGSGSVYLDNVFFRELPSPDSPGWTELIPLHSEWRYAVSAPRGDWFAVGYDDSAWPMARAKFGAGSGPTNIATELPQQKPAYYFRRTFIAPAAIQELLLSATCTDDGAPPDVYLNGTKLNTTGIEAASSPGNAVKYYDLAPFIGLLHAGLNTIAVQLNNRWEPGWDDVAFDVDLKAIPDTNTGPRLSIERAGMPGGLFTLPILLSVSGPTNTIWRVEAANRLAGPWQEMEPVTNATGAPVSLIPTFPDQFGNLKQFYRLLPE